MDSAEDAASAKEKRIEVKANRANNIHINGIIQKVEIADFVLKVRATKLCDHTVANQWTAWSLIDFYQKTKPSSNALQLKSLEFQLSSYRKNDATLF